VGVFLSGGIDSTVIASMMRKRIRNLKSYTLRLPDSPYGDESCEAIAIAKHLECENTVVEVRGDDLADLLPRFVRDLDQPSNDGLNTWLISRAAARDVRGVLSGLGGDEWFAGYPSSARLARMNGGLMSSAARAAGEAAHALEQVFGRRIPRRFLDAAARREPLARWAQSHNVFADAATRSMVGPALVQGTQTDWFAETLDGYVGDWRGESSIGLASMLDVAVYMRCQLLRDSDATSMAASLELRVPFVDLEVAAFSRTCRNEYKLSPNVGTELSYRQSGAKRVLIEAVRDLLPPGLEQREKRGFVVPLEHWMSTSLRGVVDEACSADAIKKRGLLDHDAFALALRHEDRARVHNNRWTLAVLELWLREVLDAAPQRARARAHELQLVG
jgi:asparagine synthase (glutamine-hydrolysing)